MMHMCECCHRSSPDLLYSRNHDAYYCEPCLELQPEPEEGPGGPEPVICVREGHRPEELGIVPFMIDQTDPRPAREQFDANYRHGGGWRPIEGFTLNPDGSLSYPGDPDLEPFAMMPLHDDETILFYPYALVAILRNGHKPEVARMD